MTKKNKIFSKEFNIKWGSITATIIVVFSLVAGGYASGNYLSELSCKRELLKITEEYQDKIFEHRKSCDLSRLSDLEKKQENLELTIQNLKSLKNEK